MLTWLYEKMNAIQPLDATIFQHFDNCFEWIDLPKNSLILRESEVCHYLYVLQSGLVRMYHIKDGKEINSLFIDEGYFFTAPDSFYNRHPSYHFIETLQQSTIARIHFNKLDQLYKTYPELNYVGRVITENYFVWSEERLFLLRKNNAEERYQYFLDHYPNLLQKIPLKFIASYLGMNEETLSRIRNKMSKNNLK